MATNKMIKIDNSVVHFAKECAFVYENIKDFNFDNMEDNLKTYYKYDTSFFNSLNDNNIEKIAFLMVNEELVKTVCDINDSIFNDKGTTDDCLSFGFEEYGIHNIFYSTCFAQRFNLIDSIKEYGDNLLNSKFVNKEELEKFIANNLEYK